MIYESVTDTLVAGVDSSTQSTKVLVVDVATGAVVATGTAPHTVTGANGARETDPGEWYSALRLSLAATGLASRVAAIAVGGQQHGLVVQDAAGVPLRPAILWNDTRSAADALGLRAALGDDRWAGQVGVVPVASFTVSKWAWLRRSEPGTAARVAAIRLPHDHLTGRLCGEGVTDRSDASGTGWWSTLTEGYVDEVLGLDAVAVDPALLPRVVGPREVAGTLTAGAAADLGLPAGIPVGAGAGDNAAAALGLGVPPGTPVISLGTSGTAFARTAARTVDGSGTVAGFADASGGFLPLACTLNATLAVDRFAAWLGLDRDAVEPSGGAVVLPYLDGERTPDLPLASGLVTGLRHATTPGAILMAAYEGAVASLAAALEAIDAAGGALVPGAPVVLVGGGARGATWRSVVGRLTGRPIVVPRGDQLVAYGAAAQAAALVTGEEPVAIARRWGALEGEVIGPVDRDDAVLERIAAVRAGAARLLAGPPD
jgi:xylulokinase